MGQLIQADYLFRPPPAGELQLCQRELDGLGVE